MSKTKELFAEVTRVCTCCGERFDNPHDVQSIDLYDRCRRCDRDIEFKI